MNYFFQKTNNIMNINLYGTKNNQQFFRTGKVSWNRGTSINIPCTNTKEGGPAGKNVGVFSSRYP